MENTTPALENENQQQVYLDEISGTYFQNEYATQGQRFFNWLIDNLLMRFGISYVSGMAIGYTLALVFPEFMSRVFYGENRYGLLALSYLVGIINYLFYYTICEKAFKGYTLGKIITGTRAIRQDGEELTLKDAFLRTLSRLVPFEVFSGFGTLTWHDKWTKTMVIKSR
jgi:uncharacterized RDD family membrane protein YckC